MIAPKLTDEMRQALAKQPAGPISIEDDQTQNFYVLLSKEDYCRLHDEYIRRELQVVRLAAHAQVVVEDGERPPVHRRPGDRRDQVHRLLQDELDDLVRRERRQEDERQQGREHHLKHAEQQDEPEDPPAAARGQRPRAP